MGRRFVKIRRWAGLAGGWLALAAGLVPGRVAANRTLDARWLNNQGVVAMDQHDYARGRDEFRRALALDPEYERARTNLGIALYSLGQYDSAMVALERAVDRAPDQLHAWYTLGLIYHAQGREFDRARDAFARVAGADPDDPLAHYFLGRVEAKLGRGPEALQELRRAIRLDPHLVSAHYALAQELKRQGLREESQQALAEFSRLSQQGYEGVSPSYQGQGKYAEAVVDLERGPAAEPGAVPLRFAGPFASPPGTPARPSFATWRYTAADGHPDLVVGGGHPLLLTFGGGGFAAPVPLAPGLTRSLAIHDAVFGRLGQGPATDLVLAGEQTLLLRADAAGSWRASESVAGPSRRIVLADVDHDGDLDLLLLGPRDTRLLANDGTGRFSDITAAAGLGGLPPARRAVFSDLDNDRDVDLLLLCADRLRVLGNNRDGTFTDQAAALGLDAVEAVDAAVEDFDQDGFVDLALSGADGRLTCHANRGGRRFEAVPVAAAPERVLGLQAADLDTDGDLDLLAWNADRVRPWRWQNGRWQPDPMTLAPGSPIDRVLVEDLDGNGTPEVWVDGLWWRNDTAGGRWLTVALEGLSSNRDGIGVKVEVQTPYRWQKLERRGDSRAPGVLRFGLGTADSVDFVRVLWPGGVRQSELAAAGQHLQVKEINRKGTSCPIVYAWDGERFRFVTDILGGAIIGYLTGPDRYAQPDPDEYVRLDALAPRDGRYVVQIADQLEEVMYLDGVELVAVDHPDSVEVYPNERLRSAPPYPEFRLYAVRRLRPVAAAIDQRGADQAPALLRIDDRWAAPFDAEDIRGYASPHWLQLDLGDLAPGAHPVLIGFGWVDYAHASSNWAAAQRGLELQPPRLEVPDGDGGWRVALPDVGCPAGLPKAMLCDLEGRLRPGDHRVRIAGTTPVYWDQIQVGETVAASLRVQRLVPCRGDLHWRGYPAHTAVNGTFAFRYRYDEVSERADWGTHAGAYTRFGDVTALLEQVDDGYVIMGHGDELTVEFDAAALPALAPGHRRTFLLFADGYGKDMDAHSAHGLTVGPLPFHGMPSYPYPAGVGYPLTERTLGFLLDYTTRFVPGYYE